MGIPSFDEVEFGRSDEAPCPIACACSSSIAAAVWLSFRMHGEALVLLLSEIKYSVHAVSMRYTIRYS